MDDARQTRYAARVIFKWLRSRRRRALAARPLPDAWREILVKRKLPHDDAVFVQHLMVFAHEKEWVGVEGLVVTDEMRVVVSAAAARLSRNLSFDVYDDLGTIILHPGSIAKTEDGRILGQAHRLGAVSLSWDAVKHGIANPSDGSDTTLHELAHVLDVVDGDFDGTPLLESQDDRRGWARACAAAFVKLRADGAKGVMREYGATNEAEFFAVATEVFFEKPHHLKKREPALYASLVKFYRVDPSVR
jgi:MtfA peptidase